MHCSSKIIFKLCFNERLYCLHNELYMHIFRSIRQGIIHKSLIALASCLIMSNYLFIQLTFTKPSLNKIICIITAVLLHYFTLASFMWMLVIAIAQYLTFVKVINNHVTRFMLKASLMAFGN